MIGSRDMYNCSLLFDGPKRRDTRSLGEFFIPPAQNTP